MCRIGRTIVGLAPISPRMFFYFQVRALSYVFGVLFLWFCVSNLSWGFYAHHACSTPIRSLINKREWMPFSSFNNPSFLISEIRVMVGTWWRSIRKAKHALKAHYGSSRARPSLSTCCWRRSFSLSLSIRQTDQTEGRPLHPAAPDLSGEGRLLPACQWGASLGQVVEPHRFQMKQGSLDISCHAWRGVQTKSQI